MSQMGHDLTVSFTVHTVKSQMSATFSPFSILMGIQPCWLNAKARCVFLYFPVMFSNETRNNRHKTLNVSQRDVIMEMSHQSNITKVEFGLLCDNGYHTSHVRGYIKNDLSLIRTFNNNIWCNFLGKLTTQH
jgi:hypothetical protein